jgi:predicted ATPase
MVATSQTMAGQFDPALETYSRARELYDPGRHEDLGLGMGNHPLGAVDCYQSWAELARGFPDRARAMSDEAESIDRNVGQVNAHAYTLFHRGVLLLLAGDTATATRLASGLVSLGGAHGLSFWEAMGRSILAWSLLEAGDPGGSVQGFATALAAAEATGSGLLNALMRTVLAEAIAATGDAGALAIAVAAETRARDSGSLFALAEIQRRRARMTLLLDPGAVDAAETALRAALATAREQNAWLWELRAAADLARILANQGRRGEARELLSPVHAQFTEGFGTRDLIDARALLDTLA